MALKISPHHTFWWGIWKMVGMKPASIKQQQS